MPSALKTPPAVAPSGRLKSKFAPERPMDVRITQYRTDSERCDCPANRYYKGRCKHIRAVREALRCIRAAGYAVSDKKAG